MSDSFFRCFGAACTDFLLGFESGGVESIRTDMSESDSSSSAIDFRFFLGSDLVSTDFDVSDFWGEGRGANFAGDFSFAFAGDEGGVSCITAFFRLTFFATN